jgi:hypothetical protein
MENGKGETESSLGSSNVGLFAFAGDWLASVCWSSDFRALSHMMTLRTMETNQNGTSGRANSIIKEKCVK